VGVTWKWKQKNEPITMLDSRPCDWLVLKKILSPEEIMSSSNTESDRWAWLFKDIIDKQYTLQCTYCGVNA